VTDTHQKLCTSDYFLSNGFLENINDFLKISTLFGEAFEILNNELKR